MLADLVNGTFKPSTERRWMRKRSNVQLANTPEAAAESQEPSDADLIQPWTPYLMWAEAILNLG